MDENRAALPCFLIKKQKRDAIHLLRGYRVEVVRNGLRELLLRGRREGALILCTSRLGRSIQEASSELEGALKLASEVLGVFGSPSEGLYEMAAREGLELEDACDFVLNAVPEQGVATIRTEEAVLICLALIGLLVEFRGWGEHYGRWHGHASPSPRPQGLHHAHHHDGQEAGEYAQAY